MNPTDAKKISDGLGRLTGRLEQVEKRQSEIREFSKLAGKPDIQDSLITDLGKGAIDFVRSKMNLEPVFKKDYDSLLPSPGLGQYLPEQLHSVVSFLSRGSGALLPLLSKVTVEPEQILRLPAIAEGSATWTAENVVVGTSEPVASEIKLSPKKLGSIAVLSLEAFERPNVAAATIVGNELTRAISDTLEASVLSGTTGADSPEDGILTDAAVPETAASVSGMDASDLLAFISEALVSYPGIMTGVGTSTGPVLVMTPVDFMTLVVSESGSAPGRALVDTSGPSFMGIPVVLTPNCATAGGNWLVMMRPQDYYLVGTNQIRFDSDTSIKFSSAGVMIRLLTWASFGCPQVGKLFRGPRF